MYGLEANVRPSCELMQILYIGRTCTLVNVRERCETVANVRELAFLAVNSVIFVHSASKAL